MSKKTGLIVALLSLCALSVFLVSCGSSSSRPTTNLYVLTEAVNANGGAQGFGNNVSSFAIDLDNGTLSLINANASTCATAATEQNPAPCGQPLDIVLDPTGATAFVLNQGTPCQVQGVNCVTNPASNNIPPTIFAYTVNSDGSLSAPSATPAYWSCIAQPVAPCTASGTYPDTALAMTRDAAGQFLFVIDGGLYPAPATCPATAAAVNSAADSTNFVGCPSISVFAIKPGSTTLTSVSQSTTYQSPLFLSKLPSALSTVTFTPSGSSTPQEFLFVTNHEDICTVNCIPPSPHNDNTLSVYSVSSSGVLTEEPDSPYTVASSNPVSVLAANTNAAGENDSGGIFVYVGSYPTGGGALSIYQLCTQLGQGNCTTQEVQNYTLVPITSPAPPTTGDYPVAMIVDPTNNYLYVACETANQVYGYRITPTNGVLTAISGSPQPSQGTQPVALAMQPSVHASNEYLFVSNNVSSTLGGFTVNTTSGALSSPLNVLTNPGPTGLAAQ